MIKKKLLILLTTLVFLTSCNSFKSAITGEKKNLVVNLWLLRKNH